MHGCSELNENTRPFLHLMGPSEYESTIQRGLERGLVFGFSGVTDHHCANPGSYGHGLTGLLAEQLTREAIWQALIDPRMFALTGDRMELKISLNDAPKGSLLRRVHCEELPLMFKLVQRSAAWICCAMGNWFGDFRSAI